MEVNQNKGRKKGLLVGLGVFAVGMLSFFGYQYWSGNKKKTETPEENAPSFNAEKPRTTKPTSSKPKKKHTTKKKVSVKPKPQSDTTESKTTQATKITETVKEKVSDPAVVAKGLYLALKIKSFSTALRILKTIKTPLRYAEIGRHFTNYRIGGVRQTILNAMFNVFKTDEQKEKLRTVFTEMGLKYDGSKWSLEGIENSSQIITIRSTKVWKDPRTSVEVPKNMVLGKEVAKRKNYTLFENGKQYFLVQSNHVSQYKN